MLGFLNSNKGNLVDAVLFIIYLEIASFWTYASMQNQGFQLVFPKLVDANERLVTNKIKDYSKHHPFAFPYFEAFGQNFTLYLNQNSHLLTQEFKVEKLTNLHQIDSLSTHEVADKSCQFVGTLKQHPNSSVAVNVCNGLNGIMVLNSNEYYIEPISVHANYRSERGVPHALYKRSWLSLPNNINDDLLVSYDETWTENEHFAPGTPA